MTFTQVVQDVKKLAGLELNSIRPGSNIQVLDVDEEKNNLILKMSNGAKRSRPLSELKIIWEAMLTHPAVHVDDVLHGSGTSRNQPETILANLPYVEWLKITNKKHLAYIGYESHVYGSLKQMKPADSAKIAAAMNEDGKSDGFSAVVVCSDLLHELGTIAKVCDGISSAVEQGVYIYKTEHDKILFVLEQTVNLKPGTYSIIKVTSNKNISQTRVKILGKYYSVIVGETSKFLIKQDVE